MDDASSRDDAPFDPARRKLCPDGACVGVIGQDGRCGECGRTEAEAEAGEEPAGALEAVPEPADRHDAEAGPASADASPASASGFDANRRLCEDGSCVGVVGADGACRVCGRRSQ